MNTWHLTPQNLAAYRQAQADPVLADSVEAHLLGCAACRADLAAAADPPSTRDADRRWEAIATAVDTPRRSRLGHLGVSTRPLRTAWASSVVLLLLLPLVPQTLAGGGVPTLLLALAPLAPATAVALAYRVGSDPVGEMAAATPLAGLRLVSMRALLVGLTALPLGVLAGLLLGLPPAEALAWVLPGLALSAVVLLVGTTRFDPSYAAAALGGAWAVAVCLPTALRHDTASAVAAQLATPTVQVGALAVALAAVTLTVSRRDHVAYRRTA